MSHTTLADIDHRHRRRLLVASVLRIVVVTALLLALYALLPVGRSGGKAVAELVAGLVVFLAVIGWMVRRIVSDDHPELRAVEAFGIAVPALIVVFAYAYLSLAQANPANFSQRLDHVGAVYFTVTVISTVGFGDIVARTDATRLLVTVQIVLDLVLVAGIARTIVFATRIGIRRQHQAHAAGPTEPST